MTSGFALQTLLHVVRLAAEGDIKTAMKLGIKEKQIAELLTLSSQELHDMSSMTHSPFIQISFDADILERALRINERHSERRQEIQTLVKFGASFPMMNYLYGLNKEEMSNYRKIVPDPYKTLGRPSRPSDEEQEILWEKMKPIQSLDDPRLPQRIITTHQETGIPVGSIWILLKEWWEKNDNSQQDN
jgi:hypothetical protein